MKRSISLYTVIPCIIGFVAISTNMLFKLHQPSTKTKSPNTKLVEVISTKNETFQKTIGLIGTLQPKHASTLIAKGNGRLDVIVNSGTKVTKGTLIAKIDNIEIEKNLNLSQDAAALAETSYKQLNSVSHTGYISKKEIEEKKQLWIQAQKEIATRKIERDHLRIYAPFDGIIGKYLTRDGTEIKQGDQLVQFFDPTHLTVDVDIPCNRYPNVKVGSKAFINQKTYAISHLQTMISPVSHMCPADIDIQCQSCLLGNTISVNLVIAEKDNTIVVPYQALFLRNNKPYVYVVEKDKVVLKSIQPGLQHHKNLEVLSGLNAKDQVITRGQERLYPGQTVRIHTPTKSNSA